MPFCLDRPGLFATRASGNDPSNSALPFYEAFEVMAVHIGDISLYGRKENTLQAEARSAFVRTDPYWKAGVAGLCDHKQRR